MSGLVTTVDAVAYALEADVSMPGMQPRRQRLEFAVAREVLLANEYRAVRSVAEKACEELAWNLKGTVRLVRLERHDVRAGWQNRCFAVGVVGGACAVVRGDPAELAPLPQIWP